MSVRIRDAVLASDREELIELFRRHLTPQSDARRFEWLYCSNPFGAARAWLVCDSGNGVVIGAAAAFPRKVCFGGIEARGWVLGDFCLEEKYRSLGPAMQLQRACLEAVAPPFDFCYDFPSQSMMAVYKRLGVRQIGTLVRWAKPLRAERQIEKVVRSKAVAGVVGALANMILARRGWKGKECSCELAFQQVSCGDEFTELDRQMRGRPGVQTVRGAEYLNWRYLAHPCIAHEFLTARRAGALIGYVVFTPGPEDATIVDVCSVEEPAVIACLLTGAVARLSQRGAATVSLNAGDAHPWNTLFERVGFRRRDASPVVVYTRPGATPSSGQFQRNWYLMRGERDS